MYVLPCLLRTRTPLSITRDGPGQSPGLVYTVGRVLRAADMGFCAADLQDHDEEEHDGQIGGEGRRAARLRTWAWCSRAYHAVGDSDT